MTHVENIYKTCRNNAGLTQERAAEALHVATRTLSAYENGESPVNDKMVDAMVVLYGCPSLAVQHLKLHSPLGKHLPDVVMPQTHGDMAFQVILAHDYLKPVVCEIKRIMSDGMVSDCEKSDFDEAIEMIKKVNAKLLSVIIYAGKLA